MVKVKIRKTKIEVVPLEKKGNGEASVDYAVGLSLFTLAGVLVDGKAVDLELSLPAEKVSEFKEELTAKLNAFKRVRVFCAPNSYNLCKGEKN